MRKAITNVLLSLTLCISALPASAEWYDSEHSCLERAKTLYQQGQFDQAIDAITKALSFNPKSCETLYFRGLLYSTLKRPDLALKDFDDAIAINPEVAAYYIARGTIYANRKQHEQAIAEFDQALKYEPINRTAITSKEFSQNEIERLKRAEIVRNQTASTPLTVASSSSATGSYTPVTSKGKKHSSESKSTKRQEQEIALAQEEQLKAKLDSEREKDKLEKERLLKQLEDLKLAAANRQSDKPAVVAENKPLKDKWALIIGISKFKNQNLNLRYPSKDAQDFYNFLINDAKFEKDHIKILCDDQATRSNILSELGDKWLPRVANPDDLVLIYISSHGSSSDLDVGGVNYILAHDSDPDTLFASGLPMQDLTRIIKGRVHADRVVLILDACHSGAANPESKGLVRTKNVNVDEIVAGTGQLVISSSADNQVSWESKQCQNSVFTRYLIEGLKSKGPNTTLGEAFDFMKDKVQQEVLRERGVMQTPVLKSRWQGKDLTILSPPVAPRPGL